MARSQHLWSALLPADIILLISERFKTLSDLRSFRAVCSNWRKSAAPAKLLSTSSFLPCPVPSSTHHHHDPIIVASSVLMLTPNTSGKAPWIVTAEESKIGKLQLRHPITNKPIKHSVKAFDPSCFRVSKLSRGYNLLNSDAPVKKVLVRGSFAVVLYSNGSLMGCKLAQPPNSSTWLPFLNENSCSLYWHENLDDIVCFKGVIWAVDGRGRLFTVEYEADVLSVKSVTVGYPFYNYCRQVRLVVDQEFERLLLILLDDELSRIFKLFVFDLKSKMWELTLTLGHRKVLLVGVHHCFLASSRDFPGFPEDCIIFSDESFPRFYTPSQSNLHPTSLVVGRDAVERVRVYQLGKRGKLFSSMSYRTRLSQLMWPPPIWFSYARP